MTAKEGRAVAGRGGVTEQEGNRAPRSERFLVCLGPSPFGAGLLKEARDMARVAGAELWAITVDVEGSRLDGLSRAARKTNVRLAERLGVRLFVRSGTDVARTVAAFARRNGVTRIVVGKSLDSPWKTLLRGTLTDRLIRLSGSIDVVALSRREGEAEPSLKGKGKSLGAYGCGAALALAATALGLPFSRVMAPTNVVMVYLAAVLVAAVFLGRGPSVLTAVLGVLAFDVFMVPPYYTLVVADSQYLVTFVGLLGVGFVVSGLASRAGERAQEARRKEEEALALYAFSRDLAAAAGREELLGVVTEHLFRLGWESTLILAGEDLRSQSGRPGHPRDIPAETVEDVLRHGRPRELENGQLCLPLEVQERRVGVLILHGSSGERPEGLRDAFVLQIAQSLERIVLDERARTAELAQAREKIQAALLDSVSHEIRTPLATITGVLSSLRRGDKAVVSDDIARSALIETAWTEAERLGDLVGNLLNMSRLEGGGFQLDRAPCDPSELVAHVLGRMGERLEGWTIETELPQETCLIDVDFPLLSLVLVNLLDNALKYGSVDVPVLIRGWSEGRDFLFSVADGGPGIPESFRERIFEKFFRLPTSAGGTGLGLTICRGIVEAHGGAIAAGPRSEGGTVMTMRLPEVIVP